MYLEGDGAELPSILARWSHTRFSQQQVVTIHVKCCPPGKLTWPWKLRDPIGTQANAAWHTPKPQLPKKQAAVQDNRTCVVAPNRGHKPHATTMTLKFDHRCSSSYKGAVSSLENSLSWDSLYTNLLSISVLFYWMCAALAALYSQVKS